ncbi:MAG: glycoside hydrolase family protein, partial [Planctomycetota bacterium]
HPLGPFAKHGDKPILDLGPEGAWDDKYVACAMVLKEAPKKYLMWYSGYGELPQYRKWSIGLATAEHPTGPWKKYEENPILEDFGYVGGALKIKGRYRLYSAWPISSPGYKGDYSPLALATSERPEGPYTKYAGNPLMTKGDFGDWDDGGISEAEVLYHNGAFHMFYGGTHLLGPRLESIGYAYSLDGYNWVKYGRNPVAARQANPNAAAFAEVHAIIEPPFIYLYHTLRYEENGDDRFPWFEDLGVQVLVTQRPFILTMPVLNIESLPPGKTSLPGNCPPICVGHVNGLALTAECSYAADSEGPIKLHILGSYDGITFDTHDLYSFESVLRPNREVRKTFELEPKTPFIKVRVENQSRRGNVSNIRITAALSG